MPRPLDPIPRRKFIKVLREMGYTGPTFEGGDHPGVMAKGAHKIDVPNPDGKDVIGIPLLKRILNQSSISVDDWNAARWRAKL
jgi:hypothetical protein